MKNILVLVAVLALSSVGLHAQSTNLVEAPAPPPHASASITEGQFAALLNALPSNAVTGASTTYQSLHLYGTRASLSSVPVGGITVSTEVVLTSGQVTAFLAALPTLPSGEVAANIRSVGVNRMPSGITLFVQFTQ